MRSKKGFTLIELLAVITILGVISLIAVPIVTSIIQNSSKNILISNEKLLSKAAENYYKMNTYLLPNNISNVKGINLDTLIEEGYTELIKNPRQPSLICDGYVLVEKVSSKKYKYQPYLDCGKGLITDGYYDNLHYIE